MRNIVFIVHNLKVGGIQNITRDLARYHVSMGNKVSILCLEKGGSLGAESGIDLYTLDMFIYLLKHPFLGLYYLTYKLLLRHILPLSEPLLSKPIFESQVENIIKTIEDKNGPIDAIFVRGSRSLKRTWWLNKQQVVYSLHLPFILPNVSSKIKRKYQCWVLTKLFQNKKMFSVSHYIANDLVRNLSRYNIVLGGFKVINNPCDINKINILSEQVTEGDIPDNFILGVGRLSKQKRFDLLILAYHQLNISGFKLVIMGDGNQRKPLQKLVDSLGISDSVIFTGFLNNPYPWYKKASLFVLSSDVEGFGNVIIEALACNTPVISTDCGPIQDILCGRLSKGIVAKGDVASLAKMMSDYLQYPIIPTIEDIEKFSFYNIVKQQVNLIYRQ